MVAAIRNQKSYDHRLKELVCTTGRFDIATRIGVPRSTIYGWRKQNLSKVVSLKTHDLSIEELESEVLRLSFQVSKLRCILRLLILLLRLSGYRLDNQRFTDPTTKSRLVREVERAGRVIPLRMTLKILRLSASRYHTWKSSCGLAPLTSCPRSTPQRLSFAETETIHALVTSSEYRHVPTGRLAILAQRMGRVFASPSTWYRLVKERGWRRPIHRIHPAKPTVGVRASKPNEIWHIDTTIVRLWNGAKVYVHAIIDNYSRKILAWQVRESFDTSIPAMLLAQAANNLKDVVPNVFMDSGVENVNGQVDRLLENGTMKRVMAQVDVVFSNSMIEAWWRSLKHQWLYLNKLETTDDVRRHVAFYVDEHNTVIPHRAFSGQTPTEIYEGTGALIAEQLAAANNKARLDRISKNRQMRCELCDQGSKSLRK